MDATHPAKAISILIAIGLATGACARAQQPPPSEAPRAMERSRTDGWRADLRFVREQLLALHPNPFHGVDRDVFDAALASAAEDIEATTDTEMLLRLMRLVALLGAAGGEGHSGVRHRDHGRLPVQLYEFPEGIYVVDTDDDRAGDRGWQLLAIDGRAPAEILAALAPLVPADNPTNHRVRRLFLTHIPELLAATGCSQRESEVTARLRDPATGAERTSRWPRIASSAARAAMPHMPFMLPPDDTVRWLRHREIPLRMELLAEHDAVYVQYHAMQARAAGGVSIAAFARSLAALAGETPERRVIIDLRNNGGGSNTTYRPLLRMLRDHPRINAAGHLMLLTGRATFSAAGNFVTEAERSIDHVTLIGEAPGGAPNQYGDARSVQLPHSPAITVRIATRYHEKSPRDARLEHAPHVPVALSAADYFAGRDPVLDAALAQPR